MDTRNPRPLSRRTFLRASGVALALPFLDAMRPRAFAAEGAAPPRRMIVVGTVLGMHPAFFFPTGTGREYQSSPYLDLVKDHRDALTVFSGLAHEGTEAAGHSAELSFLTAARNPQLPGFRNSISLDQFVADRIGPATRYPSLTLGTGGSAAASLSVNRSGVTLPMETRPSKVFARLFLDGTPEEIDREVAKLAEGRSVLDAVSDQAKRLGGSLGVDDRAKLEEYCTSVREMEQRLQAMQTWSRKPKPKIAAPVPTDVQNASDLIAKMDLLFGLLPLAVQTDSTRVITIMIGESNSVYPIPGVSMGHHALSHHGQEPEKIAQLRRIEEAMMRSVGGLLTKLDAIQEGGVSGLRNTMVLFGSNLSNASNHSTINLPILLAGGGFKHGQHLMVAPKGDLRNIAPLSNLFVSMLQGMGMEVDRFGGSSGALSALEKV